MTDRPTTHHVHVTITNPDPYTANRAALSVADFLRAEFPGVRVTTDAREWTEPAPVDDAYAHRAERAERTLEDYRRALADALAVHPDTRWPQLIEHARAYVHHTDTWRTIAVGRRKRLERAEDERDRYRAAWQSARTRARRKHDDALANSGAYHAERTRRERAEHSAKGWQDTAHQYASNADYWRERAEKAEAALDRVRLADSLGAALAAVADHDGLTPPAVEPEVITDREAIRNALDEPEQTEPARCCGKPTGAVCVHDLIQPAEPLPARLCVCPCHGEVSR